MQRRSGGGGREGEPRCKYGETQRGGLPKLGGRQIETARTQVLQVHLAVTASNGAAVALYEHLGFIRYGTEPRALKVNGRYLDEHLMVLQFS